MCSILSVKQIQVKASIKIKNNKLGPEIEKKRIKVLIRKLVDNRTQRKKVLMKVMIAKEVIPNKQATINILKTLKLTINRRKT